MPLLPRTKCGSSKLIVSVPPCGKAEGRYGTLMICINCTPLLTLPENKKYRCKHDKKYHCKEGLECMALEFKAITPIDSCCTNNRHQVLYGKYKVGPGRPLIRHSSSIVTIDSSLSNCRICQISFRKRAALQTFGMQVQCLDKDDASHSFLEESKSKACFKSVMFSEFTGLQQAKTSLIINLSTLLQG